MSVKKKNCVELNETPFQGQIPHSAARGSRPQASITSQRNKTFKDFYEVKKLAREFILHIPTTPPKKEEFFFEWNIIPSFHAPAQTNDSGLCIVLRKLVSVQHSDSYFDEGISKCHGFSRNTLGRRGNKRNMKKRLSHLQIVIRERKNVSYIFKS